MKQPYDPKLKEAMEEIKTVLTKYDCLGTVFLVSPTNSEYLFHIDASWSVMKFDRDPLSIDGKQSLRFRSKKADFPSKEAQHEATEATVHFITSTLQFGRMIQRNMQELLNLLKSHMVIAYDVWK